MLKDSTNKISQSLQLDIPNYQAICDLVNNGTTQPTAVMDLLGVENSFWNRFYYEEIIKFVQADFKQFRDFVISKLPWILFCLMPIYALLLKMIYFRRKFLYIDHLVFAFHFHSFLFLIGIFYLLAKKITGMDAALWVMTAINIYTLLAFKNVYGQSWMKTILKMILLFLTYMITLLICLMIFLVIMFLLF